MKAPEVWMRGPIAGVPPLLQPVAHALLQAAEEVSDYTAGIDQDQLWMRPSGTAAAGFHLQHMRGVIDRLFTYARAASLSKEQLDDLAREGVATDVSAEELVRAFRAQVDDAIAFLKTVSDEDLLAQRGIGRKQIPTTTIGLLFHTAEHTQRHLGQLLVTCRWVKALTAEKA